MGGGINIRRVVCRVSRPAVPTDLPDVPVVGESDAKAERPYDSNIETIAVVVTAAMRLRETAINPSTTS